jgi:AraC-like DNA-binding protein
MAPPEIILRTVAVLALLSLAGVMLVARRRDAAPVLGALLAVAVAAFVVTSGKGADERLGNWLFPLTAICVAKAAFFWLFARGLFADRFRLRLRDGAMVGVTMAFGLWQQLAFADREQLGVASDGERLASAGFELWVLALVCLALAEAYRGLGSDLLEPRRRLRIVFVAGVSALLAAAVLVQGYNLVAHTQTPALLVTANLVLITTAALAALWNLVQVRRASWLDPEPGDGQPARLSPLEQKVLGSLQEAFDRQRVYREEGLTITALAERLGTREAILRRVINRGLGYRNFNDFLHEFRVREACGRLLDPKDARLPVLSIALGVGYSSIGPFNRAFKARTGMTPTGFRHAGRGTAAT